MAHLSQSHYEEEKDSSWKELSPAPGTSEVLSKYSCSLCPPESKGSLWLLARPGRREEVALSSCSEMLDRVPGFKVSSLPKWK